MSDPILIAIIAGVFALIQGVISAGARIKAAEVHKGSENNQKEPAAKSEGLRPFYLIIIGILILGIAIFFAIRNEKSHVRDYWTGMWISNEEWENGSNSIGAITLKQNDGKVEGASFNSNLQKSDINGVVVGGVLKGTWKNQITKKSGNLEFKVKEENEFSGFYELDGIIKNWIGERFEDHFTHKIDARLSPNKKFGFRNISFTSDSNNGTLIGEIEDGSPLMLIE